MWQSLKASKAPNVHTKSSFPRERPRLGHNLNISPSLRLTLLISTQSLFVESLVKEGVAQGTSVAEKDNRTQSKTRIARIQHQGSFFSCEVGT